MTMRQMRLIEPKWEDLSFSRHDFWFSSGMEQLDHVRMAVVELTAATFV